MADFSAFITKKANAQASLVIGLLGTVFLAANIIFSFVAGPQDGIAQTLYGIYFYVSLLACVGGLGIYLTKKNWVSKHTYLQFLLDNGWQATRQADVTHIATSLINPEMPPSVAYGFSGQYKGLEMHAIKYSYVAGSGREERVSSFINLSFVLGHNFPLLVLDDKKNDFLFTSNLPERIPGGRALQLEGNFNDRFRLTVLPDTERDVLHLMTPDFMHELLESRSAADVEIAANQLFIVARSAKFDEKTLCNLFGMADIVLKNIEELSDTWQASSSPQALENMALKALGPRLGTVLKPKNLSVGGIILGVIAYLALVIIATQP